MRPSYRGHTLEATIHLELRVTANVQARTNLEPNFDHLRGWVPTMSTSEKKEGVRLGIYDYLVT